MPTCKRAVEEATQPLYEMYWCMFVCVCVSATVGRIVQNSTVHDADDAENIICTARCCPLIVHLAQKRCSRLGDHRKSMSVCLSASIYLVPSVVRRTEETNELISLLEARQLSVCVCGSPDLTFYQDTVTPPHN